MEEKTYAGLLKEAEKYLGEQGITESKLDAWYLFSGCFSMDKARYFMDGTLPVPEQDIPKIPKFRYMVEKRGKRIPLQQILGEQEFMGLTFFVNEHVLIPRQDTETLVEQVLEDRKRSRSTAEKKNRILRILDLCTGSGCIGISLAKYLSADSLSSEVLQIVLSDISAEALLVAEENIRRLECDGICSTVQSDLFEQFGQKQSELFDVIVSNPPYIPSSVIGTLEPEVKDHEPLLALDGTEDGLAFYRRIAAEAAGHLKPDGQIYVEIGCEQGEQVKALFEKAAFEKIEIMKDLAGRDRVVKASMPSDSEQK